MGDPEGLFQPSQFCDSLCTYEKPAFFTHSAHWEFSWNQRIPNRKTAEAGPRKFFVILCDTIEFRAVQVFHTVKYQISWDLSFLALEETYIIVDFTVYLPKVRGIQEVTQGRLVISIHVFFRANQHFYFITCETLKIFRVCDRLRRKSRLMSVKSYKALQLPWEMFNRSKSEKV